MSLMVKNNIYLDYASATPLDKRVLKAMEPYFSEKFHNPSSDYSPAREAKQAVEESRKTIARFLGAKPAEIVFTAGGTEANNLAILGVAGKFPKSKIICSSVEHDSVIQTVRVQKRKGHQVEIIGVDRRGLVDLSAFDDAIDDNTVLVSIMYANNEVGTLQPLGKIAQKIQNIRDDRRSRGVSKPLYLHTDACQATQYLNMRVSRLGVDLMTINSDKIYGPKQCGALFVKAGTGIEPLVFGGDQERGLRSGTENVPSIVGFAEAVKLVEQVGSQETKRMQKLRDYFASEIETIKGVKINGLLKKRLPNNLHVTFANCDNERLLMQLDERRIYVSTGSACSASKGEPSYVLKAIGMSAEEISGSLRFSLGRPTTKADIDKTVSALKALVV
jgi:cysteine desulfurase